MTGPTDRGPLTPHVRCWCVECERKHGDQADPEHDELLALRREVAVLRASRDGQTWVVTKIARPDK